MMDFSDFVSGEFVREQSLLRSQKRVPSTNRRVFWGQTRTHVEKCRRVKATVVTRTRYGIPLVAVLCTVTVTVVFTRSTLAAVTSCQLSMHLPTYIIGNYVYVRSQGGRQPAAAVFFLFWAPSCRATWFVYGVIISGLDSLALVSLTREALLSSMTWLAVHKMRSQIIWADSYVWWNDAFWLRLNKNVPRSITSSRPRADLCRITLTWQNPLQLLTTLAHPVY